MKEKKTTTLDQFPVGLQEAEIEALFILSCHLVKSYQTQKQLAFYGGTEYDNQVE